MLEAGLGEYWKRMYWPSANVKCGDQPSSKREAKRRLSLIDLQSAFLVLAMGVAAAFVAFIGECLFYLIRHCLTQNL